MKLSSRTGSLVASFLFVVSSFGCGSSSDEANGANDVNDVNDDAGSIVNEHDAGQSNPSSIGDDGGTTTDPDGEAPPQDQDAGDDPDASAPVNTDPLPAKAGEWTWFDFPESSCANGKPTGIGVNLGTSKEVFIYLEGGGACWDYATCYVAKTGDNVVDGYVEKNFQSKVGGGFGDMFDRKVANNPFKDMSYVYVPYCTGDVHAGDSVNDYNGHKTHHVGRRNLETFLARIVPTFGDASRVVFAGSSAGGFGAAMNYWRVQKAFGATRVDLIDDSGPPVDQSSIKFFNSWKKAWNLGPAFPAGCNACADNINAVVPYYASAYPSSRFSLLSYDHDRVISLFFVMLQNQFDSALTKLVASINQTKNVRSFVVSGDKHVLIRDMGTTTANTKLGDWLNDMVTDSPLWVSVKP